MIYGFDLDSFEAHTIAIMYHESDGGARCTLTDERGLKNALSCGKLPREDRTMSRVYNNAYCLWFRIADEDQRSDGAFSVELRRLWDEGNAGKERIYGDGPYGYSLEQAIAADLYAVTVAREACADA